MPKSWQTIIAVVLAVAVIMLGTYGDHPPALAATPASACQSVTPRSVSASASAIDRALRYANADARANGQNGNYAVAARNSLDLLAQAGHWALISAAYHKSTDARDAFEGTVTALAEGQRLFAESGRCFLTNYRCERRLP